MEKKEGELFSLLRMRDMSYMHEVCKTVLLKATSNSDVDIVKMVVELWSEYIDDRTATKSYRKAFKRQNMEIMKVLGPRIGHLRNTFRICFDDICYDGISEERFISVHFARYCIENEYYPLCPFDRNNQLFCCAVSCGNVELVKLLMTYPGVDPSLYDQCLRYCLKSIPNIYDVVKRVRYIETVRTLLSDVRVNNSILRKHRYAERTNLFIPEVADMIGNALRRRELCLDMKIKAIPAIVPKFLRFLIVAQSIIFEAIADEENQDIKLDLRKLRTRFHIDKLLSLKRKETIEKISKCIESFLQ